ncbi:TPA: class I SAM-dependent methyltransferase [Streptococcus agalactiae]
MKITLHSVAETLLITLYIRAKDAMAKHPILNDQKSLAIVEQIEYDFDKFDNSEASFYATLARIRVMDREIKKFIRENPNSHILSIGCGLDTRFERVDNGQIRWYNLDLPEVMEIRKLFFEEHERVTNIAKSALDETWTREVNPQNAPFLIVSEGVLMFLKEDVVETFLHILTNSFSQFMAQFDLCQKEMINKGKQHDTVKYMDTEFQFGITDGHEIVDLDPKLKQINLINFTDEMSKFELGTLRSLLPTIRKFNNCLGVYEYKASEKK